ncbi:hypothetical protein L2D14_18220 [Thalassospiraceae bacterium LMO-JJ14]|nr:hypothetical protein L2D14_18220 [Thalassospiraceae bacterium LMO-JJ14]
MLAPQIMPVAYINGTADDCRAPITLRLIDYWRARMPEGNGLPRLQDFELMDLYDIATSLAIKDAVDDGRDFKNRFWGSDLTIAFGFEGSGRLVSSYELSNMRYAVSRRYAYVYTTGTSSMARGHISWIPGKEYLAFELVHLPLWGTGDSIQHIISAYHFGFELPENASL